ncbi:MAG: ATP-grasp domain-containing protein [Rhizobiales bacterium]|nr:ATP-grasp domain-containing protein [Hyphomicrobiales bacterium]
MLKSVLIANRGEIACRVIATARRLGLRTIAVYSDADAEAPHVLMADEAHRLGPPPARESYLLGDKIIAIAKASGAEAIHPGYGFLSENADFADACKAAGIVFVGPPGSAIRAMGLKDGAKALMQKAGVPVVPGYHGERQDAKFLREKAYEIGYPVLIKAVAGGGGKGMKKVETHIAFEEALESAKREAANACGNDHVLVEKYIQSPRHVEVQVFADSHGEVVHLFERDCSLQRRHQKVIEEAPAPGMTPEVRAAMGRAAVEAARAVGYVGAGTVEFIADGAKGLRADGFYFMEMNTRLQVEHPVTEAITGLDLVDLQLRVASGERLTVSQNALTPRGHAVEARLYAEDPENGFLPSIGKLWSLDLPDAPVFAFESGEPIRIDCGVQEGGEVSPFYDPMIAKVIARGATRDEALDALSEALSETIVAGPRTNVAFLKALADAPDFRAGRFDTGFIDRNVESLGATPRPPDAQSLRVGAAQIYFGAQWRHSVAEPDSPWSATDGFQLSGARRTPLKFLANGEVAEAILAWDGTGADPQAEIDGILAPMANPRGDRATHVVDFDGGAYIVRAGRQTEIRPYDPLDVDVEGGDHGDSVVKAPMHGKLVALFVAPGESVAKGQKLAVIEAMKMEHMLVAPREGVVHAVGGTPGQQIAQGAMVVAVGEA